MKIKNWDIFAFIVFYHIMVIAMIPVALDVASWGAFWLFLVTYIIGGMSITVGYHRLYATKPTQRTAFSNGASCWGRHCPLKCRH